jgi:hypothetical protein
MWGTTAVMLPQHGTANGLKEKARIQIEALIQSIDIPVLVTFISHLNYN